MSITYRSLYWEDVNEGDSVPAVSLACTLRQLVIAAGSERDFAPIHHDAGAAQEGGNRTAFANTTFQQAFCNRVINDWMGPEGDLRKLRIGMRAPIYAGTTLTGSGKVVKKYQEGGENRLDLELSLDTEDGHCTDVTATVSLPSRGSR